MLKDRIHYHYTKKCHITLVKTVSKNEAGYSKRQLKTAKVAREIYAKVGHPSNKGFSNLINSNLINNFPVTLEDAIRADKIYGPNIATFKGKTNRSNLYIVVTGYITVPK